MQKLVWLVSHHEFKRHPLRVLLGVLRWEWHKLIAKPIALRVGNMSLIARSFDGNGRLMCYFGESFDELYEFLQLYLKPGMTFVDVGANIGSHTIHAAQLVGPEGKAYAFEADPETCGLLKDNIALNDLDNTVVQQICVTNQTGPLTFYVNKDSAKSSLVEREGRGVKTLPGDTLDNLYLSDRKIDVLKIDVEGADLTVLQGARGIFGSDRAPTIVVIEVLDVVNNVDHRDEIVGFLQEHGYDLCEYHSNRLTPVVDRSLLNAYAVRRADAAAVTMLAR